MTCIDAELCKASSSLDFLVYSVARLFTIMLSLPLRILAPLLCIFVALDPSSDSKPLQACLPSAISVLKPLCFGHYVVLSLACQISPERNGSKRFLNVQRV